jgi:hypothetical protein
MDLTNALLSSKNFQLLKETGLNAPFFFSLGGRISVSLAL